MNLEGYGVRHGDSLIQFFGGRGGGVSGTELMWRVSPMLIHTWEWSCDKSKGLTLNLGAKYNYFE